jgi:N-acetylmuramoyl-L-alanine amidase
VLRARPAAAALLATLLLPASAAKGQDPYSLTLRIADTPPRTSTVGSFVRGTTIYASANDIAQELGASTVPHTQARKLEVRLGTLSLRISQDNPYLVVADRAGGRNVFQMGAPAVVAAGSWFVPAASFAPVLGKVLRRTTRFDPEERSIAVGSATPERVHDITSILLEEKANGMLIRIPSARKLGDIESILKPDGWLYLTVADVRADIGALNATPPKGILSKVVAIQSPASVQLTFKFRGPVAASEILRPEGTNDILLSVRTPGAEDVVLLEKRKREVQAGLEQQRKRWELDVIVLDAGHGGKDWGAIGVKGTREKDVTLAVTLKLGRLLEKNLKGVKVVYTRKDDVFVELDRRGKIANAADGKLFVSIHANSLPQKPRPVRGFEVYLLRPGRTEEAVTIAERENSVIEMEEGYEKRYQELTEENFILVTMAQSAHMKASETFADLAQQEMADVGIPNRGVKQAGFYVLVGASMPNVLVETAYLSNPQDEAFLRSESGQRKIAEALFRAIRRYKQEHEKLLNEGRDLGEAR